MARYLKKVLPLRLMVLGFLLGFVSLFGPCPGLQAQQGPFPKEKVFTLVSGTRSLDDTLFAATVVRKGKRIEIEWLSPIFWDGCPGSFRKKLNRSEKEELNHLLARVQRVSMQDSVLMGLCVPPEYFATIYGPVATDHPWIETFRAYLVRLFADEFVELQAIRSSRLQGYGNILQGCYQVQANRPQVLLADSLILLRLESSRKKHEELCWPYFPTLDLPPWHLVYPADQ